MAKVEADIDVKRFSYEGGDDGTRLTFPHAEMKRLEGRAGATSYGAGDCAFDGLEARFGSLRWAAETASVGTAWLRDDAGRFDIAIERAEFPHGMMLARSVEHSVELVSPHVTFSELRLKIAGPFSRKTEGEPSPAPTPTSPTARQEQLRFLDSLSGRIYLTIKVALDLPVVGKRSLDQQLRVPIQEGSLDYRALDQGLDWLEGTFLDIKHEDQRLKVQWKVPIVGAGHDLITWALDNEASTLASFGRVPVRSLADFRIGSGQKSSSGNDKRSGVLRAFTLDGIDVALSLLAPRHLEVGGGTIMFGGDDQPGMVDLKVHGAIRDRGPGKVTGTVGSIDTTIKDLKMGTALLSADRLHFDGIDTLEVEFDGFQPKGVTLVVHRVTATNLSIKMGDAPPPPALPQRPSSTGRFPRMQ